MEAIREAIEMCPDEGRVKILSTEAPVIIIISYLNQPITNENRMLIVFTLLSNKAIWNQKWLLSGAFIHFYF